MLAIHLQISGNNFSTYFDKTFHWVVGGSYPALAQDLSYNVVKVEASELELAFIRRQFTNIPFANANTCLWKEPWATFIYQNLEHVIASVYGYTGTKKE